MNRLRGITAGCFIISVVANTALFSAEPAAENTGAITGKLASPWLQRNYQMVVYVEKAPGKVFPKPAKTPVMDQIKRVYTPHVLPVVVGWEVEFRNGDPELHNIMGRFLRRTLFNFGIPPQAPAVKKKMEKEGIVTLLCSIHTEMSAYILVLQNPYFALVPNPKEDEKQRPPAKPEADFKIKNVPPGAYNLKVWGEKLEKQQLLRTFPVIVQPGKTSTVELRP